MESADTGACAAVEGTGCLSDRSSGPCETGRPVDGTGLVGSVEGGGCGCSPVMPGVSGWLGLVLVTVLLWRR